MSPPDASIQPINPSTTSGSISGSSPCTLTTISSPSPRATSAIRSVPLACRAICHDASRAERTKRINDPLIVGRDDYLSHQLALAHTIDHMLHQRPAGFTGENLGGKARRTKAGGDDNRRSQSHASREPPANFKLRSKNSETERACQTTICAGRQISGKEPRWGQAQPRFARPQPNADSPRRHGGVPVAPSGIAKLLAI